MARLVPVICNACAVGRLKCNKNFCKRIKIEIKTLNFIQKNIPEFFKSFSTHCVVNVNSKKMMPL